MLFTHVCVNSEPSAMGFFCINLPENSTPTPDAAILMATALGVPSSVNLFENGASDSEAADGNCLSLRGNLSPQSHVFSQNALNLSGIAAVLLHAVPRSDDFLGLCAGRWALR